VGVALLCENGQEERVVGGLGEKIALWKTNRGDVTRWMEKILCPLLLVGYGRGCSVGRGKRVRLLGLGGSRAEVRGENGWAEGSMDRRAQAGQEAAVGPGREASAGQLGLGRAQRPRSAGRIGEAKAPGLGWPSSPGMGGDGP
jgi:hypothetical protein